MCRTNIDEDSAGNINGWKDKLPQIFPKICPPLRTFSQTFRLFKKLK